jgi:hypothetical protein
MDVAILGSRQPSTDLYATRLGSYATRPGLFATLLEVGVANHGSYATRTGRFATPSL